MSERYPTQTQEQRETAVAAASLAIQRGGLVQAGEFASHGSITRG